MVRSQLSDKQYRALMRNRTVRQQLQSVARRAMVRAQQITDEEGGEATIGLEAGIRPGGRSYVNLTSDNPGEELGTERKRRRRALGRAIREV
ncbi:hypothetical protein ACH47B_06555 [Rhodococcus sp. NPDC019627]|uniref:hypothetical protein n=1 Tax=unclassified Rhodococcus (in: high G+C Gram-positive bacteria) TaxID=192944 RepID=UPI00378C8D0D